LPGTTAEEAAASESLDQALGQERPERPTTEEALSLLDEATPDAEDELVADAVWERDGFASPEE
jgi:hypothetical protein